jgi:hypothetical protein
MTKLKRLTIEQTKQLTKYQASKAQELLIFGHCVMSTDDLEAIINPSKPFAYLTK